MAWLDMTDSVVDLLNAIGSGVSQGTVDTLIQAPSAYNSGLYELSLNVANVAVKPVASVVLAIVFSLEMARVFTKVDGDRELGVKMVAAAMLRIALVFAAAQNSDVLLKGIDGLGQAMLDSFHSTAPTTGGAAGMGLGDQMRDAISDGGIFAQIPMLVLLIIPFLASKIAELVFTVVILLRFIQVYMLTAFNPLPIAFIAQEQTQQWGVGYFKSYATAVFQAGTLYLAVLMYRQFVSGVMKPGSFNKGDSLTGWVVSNFGGLLMGSVLLIGTVMVANSVGRRLFGGE